MSTKNTLNNLFKEIYVDELSDWSFNDPWTSYLEANSNRQRYGVRLNNKRLYKVFGGKEKFDELIKSKLWKLNRS